jgi:hypothetical protein
MKVNEEEEEERKEERKSSLKEGGVEAELTGYQ